MPARGRRGGGRDVPRVVDRCLPPGDAARAADRRREIVRITPEGAEFFGENGAAPGHRDEIEVDWDDEAAEKQGYETFMLKEIYEQPDAVRETIGERIRPGGRLGSKGSGSRTSRSGT